MENNGQLEWRRFDDLSHIEKPHYTESIFLQKFPPGLRVRVGADGIPNIKYSYYTKEWDLEPTPQDIKWYKEYVHDRLGQIRETFERIKY